MCQCPTSGFTHFYGTPPKPTIFQYVPSPNLHMFLKSVYFFSFLGSFLVFSTFFQNYSQNHICIIPNFQTLCKKKIFPPFIFEPYHRHTICNPKKHITFNLKYHSFTSNGLSSKAKKYFHLFLPDIMASFKESLNILSRYSFFDKSPKS